MISSTYVYRARVLSVYDGDTITVDIDLGFNTGRLKEKLRLARIDAPEVRGESRPQGLISRDWLRDKIGGMDITIQTIKDKRGKYGRYIAEIYLDGININTLLVDCGMAEYKEY